MTSEFDFALIDAQWVLSRNYFAICGGNRPTGPEFHYQLVNSCLSSIFNMTEWCKIGKIVLVFDTYPYFKTQMLNGDYKSDRHFMTEDAANEIEDEEERRVALIEADNFKKRSKAKKILKHLNEVGLPSLWRYGYEADDLVYLASHYLEEQGYTSLLVSVDSDWKYWMSKNSALYNPKSDEVYTESRVRSEENIPSKYSLMDYKAMYDSCYGSHNNMYSTINEVGSEKSIEILFDEIKRGDFSQSFENPSLAKLQLDTFNFRKYPDYYKINNTLESLLYSGSMFNESTLAKVSTEKKIDFPVYKFLNYKKTLNPKLFDE